THTASCSHGYRLEPGPLLRCISLPHDGWTHLFPLQLFLAGHSNEKSNRSSVLRTLTHPHHVNGKSSLFAPKDLY
ncbi:mCG145501, partial [Mus musculus]